jgi:hypothetical protein
MLCILYSYVHIYMNTFDHVMHIPEPFLFKIYMCNLLQVITYVLSS